MSGSTRQGDDRLGFYDQLLHDERRHQFYSRALGWVMFVSMVAIVVLGVVAAGQRAPADPECRAASAALPPAIEPMQLELERDALRVRRLLRGPDEIRYPTPPAYSEALCVEARAGRHRDLLGLDSAVFIPLYLMLGLCALAWYYFLALRARGADWARRGRVPLALIAWLLASAALLAVAAWRDAAENKAAQAVLDYALGGAPITGSASDWRGTVATMHAASVCKWSALAVWAATLAVLAGLRRRSLSLPRGSERRRRWSAGVAWLVLASALVATVALGAGAVLAWGASAEAARHSATQLLDIGFGAVLCHAVRLFVVHRLHLPRRMVLPAS